MRINGLIYLIGLFFLVLTGFALITSHQGFAQRLITFAFWILVLATIHYIKQVRNK